MPATFDMMHTLDLAPLIFGVKKFFTLPPYLGNPADGRRFCSGPIQACFPNAAKGFEHDRHNNAQLLHDQLNLWMRFNWIISVSVHRVGHGAELRLASYDRVWSAPLNGGTPCCYDPIEGTLYHALLAASMTSGAAAVLEL